MDYEEPNERNVIACLSEIRSIVIQGFLSFVFVRYSVRLLANNHRKKKAELHSGIEIKNIAIASDNTEQRAEVHLLHKALRCLKRGTTRSFNLV